MSKAHRSIIFTLLWIMVLMPGCGRKPASETPATSTSTTTITLAVIQRATPYANEPAAGICAEPEGVIVEVYANPDIPDPRCVIVEPEQKLRVYNKTQGPIEVSLGTFKINIDPGLAGLLDQPFGDYLEPGVHVVMVSPCCGPELWLKGD